ncbi:MAG: LON peptidase substrate-binding domain-containing protein [Candidatus Thalassarchaeaceae archaeon]
MSEKMTVPLFVLPSGIFPSVSESLRVFEPRYKQMLDDCTIDEIPFGYIAHDSESESTDGWSQPSSFGVLCSLEDMREQGTNIMFTANGNQRFEILNVIQSALPSMPFGDIYPTVDDLVEQYVEDSPEGKLYLRAEIRLLDEVDGEIPAEEWSSFLQDWAQHIVDVNAIFRNEDIDLEQMVLILDEEFLPYDTPSLWQVANAVLDKQEDRQSALSSSTSEDVFSVLQQALREKNAQLNFIRALSDAED